MSCREFLVAWHLLRAFARLQIDWHVDISRNLMVSKKVWTWILMILTTKQCFPCSSAVNGRLMVLQTQA